MSSAPGLNPLPANRPIAGGAFGNGKTMLHPMIAVFQ